MAGHGDPKTTRLYDRRDERVSLDEVERNRNMTNARQPAGLNEAAPKI